MISVILATYNGSEFLKEQLDSIRNQTVTPSEVIICDDSSTDDTADIVKEYIASNQLVNWKFFENSHNIGHYNTFLKLVSLAEEPYVFFSDQDDIWLLDKIEKMVSELQKNNVSMVYCASNFIDEHGNIFNTPLISGGVFESSLHNQLTKWPSGYQTAIKKEILDIILERHYDRMAGFDFHDVLFGFLAPLFGKVIKVDCILDSHRIHRNNVTKSVKNKSFLATKEEREAYIKKVLLRLSSLEKIAEEVDSKYKEEISIYKNFTNSRINFLSSFSFNNLFKLFKERQFYADKKDFIGDIIYSMNLSKFARKLIEVRGNYAKHK